MSIFGWKRVEQNGMYISQTVITPSIDRSKDNLNKLCVECRWYKSDPYTHYCTSPNRQSDTARLVTGVGDPTYCICERRYYSTIENCGPAGVNWEPKVYENEINVTISVEYK